MSENPIENKVLASHFATCFSTKSGEAVLKHLERLFDNDEPAFVKMGPVAYDPIEAAIRDGRRQPIIHIRRNIKLALEQKDKPKQTKAKK